MERPSRAKKNYWPAQVVIEHTIQRRTPNQVKVDQEKAKKDAAAAKAAAIAHKQSQLDRVASLEDAMQARDDARSLEDLRPDLHIDHKSGSISDVDTLSDSHLALEEPIEIPRLPSIEIPRPPLTELPFERSSYRSSSHNEEFLTGGEELRDNAAEINEGDDEENILPRDEAGSEAEEDQTQLRKKPTPKTKFKPQVRSSFSR